MATRKRRKTDSEIKRTNVSRQQKFKSKTINIGDEIDRWANIKAIFGCEKDELVAKTLIDW